MRSAQLYIKDTGKYIQLGQDKDFPFTLSKSIAEVQNVSKRNKTFSHTFKIPATEDNVKALGYPHVIGTDLDAVKNLRQACYVIVNGNVLEEGAVYVVSATSDLDVRQFDCVFIGGDEIWTEPLRTLKMSDLVTESVAYTDAGLQASFTSFTAGTDYIRWVNPYMYKFSDSQSPSAEGDDFWLAYRVDKLLIRMIGEAAIGLALQGLPYFQLDSVFIEQNDTGASHGFWDYIFWTDRSRGEYSVSFPNTLDGVAGGNIQIGEFFPTDVTALDFLLGFVRTFNCVMQWNNDTSTLKIEPRFDWESWDGTSYSGFYGTDVDWSEKISKANTVQYSLPYKRFIQLNYVADPNDSNNELLYGGKKELENDRPSGDLSTAANFPDRRYFVDTGNINEDGASVIDMYFHPSNPNLFSETFKKNYVASSFSLTPAFNNRFVKYDQIDFNHPNVFANRLFIYTRSAATDFTAGTNQWDSWRYTEDDGTTTVDYSTYPVMYTFGIFDDADGGTDVFNLGVYNNFSTLYTGGLYERFWKSTLDTFSTTRLLKAKVLMTRSEYISLDISNYFTALGQRFILNKIKDFDPMLDEQMVEVELLAVDSFRSSEEIEPPSLLLDVYGEDVKIAYSVRKLRTAYSGNCMRVRNGSSVELDIGFDSSGNLDESALLTHCGSGDGFIVKWYDQSGNGGDLEQSTTANQPQIVSSGAVLKDNGKPVITGLSASNGSHLDLKTPKTTYLPSTGQYYFFSVCKTNTPRGIFYRENTRFQLIAQDGNTSTSVRNSNYAANTYRKNTVAYTPVNRGEVYTSFASQTMLTIDGSLDNSVSSFVLGYGVSQFANWDMQEFIVYEGDKSSDESNIETAINGHYSIY